ncbi:hypothetical protein NHX12_021428 [Muraenolepis orangiensis]|uniref:G-protein coupled receptors family 1 profile domain-containing protein n=1 Tax=Muraenolepis orangiensis TaxID=630683 RepID=A0A9Q0IVI9_9TELE|nr:hypothetical protein NHX12_021428 [Muraenolepis orangiensis]
MMSPSSSSPPLPPPPPPGIVSLITLAVLSYERYCTMLNTTVADSRRYGPALLGICFSWLYSAAWTVPPLLGWSSYGPEGPGTSCSVDWRTQTANNVSYILCLFLFCLVLPFSIILYSYSRLLLAIRQVSRVSTPLSRRREQRVLLMVVTMVTCYLLCWLPYGVVALLSTFGPRDGVGPEASVVPSLLAKSSTVPSIDPAVRVHDAPSAVVLDPPADSGSEKGAHYPRRPSTPCGGSMAASPRRVSRGPAGRMRAEPLLPPSDVCL